MNVCAKSAAALLAAMALGSHALAQTEAPSIVALSYTEITSELMPRWDAAQPAAPGLRVEAVHWTQLGSNASFGLALGMALEPGLRDAYHRVRPGIGLRWRSNVSDRQRLDVATWRNFQAERGDAFALLDDAEPAPLTTRVEMQFVPPKGRGFGAEHGAIGLQLSSDTKLQLRIKRGGPMVYYRSKF